MIIIGIKITLLVVNNNKKVDFKEFEQLVDNFSNSEKQLVAPEQFYFDPNNVEEEDLKKLGFSQKAINSIINFKTKGGKFYKKEDLKKIYNVTEEEYEFVKDFITISNFSKNTKKNKYPQKIDNKQKNYQNNQSDEKPKYQSSKDKTIIIELNTATEEDLQKLSGIGSTFAKRIIDYKNKLGGYIDIEQLKEVYGLNSELFENIKEQLTVDENKIKKININTADFKELISHPYIDRENAMNILNYKKFAGKISSFDDLLKQKAISKEFYNKIQLYITTEKQ